MDPERQQSASSARSSGAQNAAARAPAAPAASKGPQPALPPAADTAATSCCMEAHACMACTISTALRASGMSGPRQHCATAMPTSSRDRGARKSASSEEEEEAAAGAPPPGWARGVREGLIKSWGAEAEGVEAPSGEAEVPRMVSAPARTEPW
ncbi:hypothetical protein TSOC_000815 [Tetrabaena socialis]|uniref:Uncharacterized protein n=1 Tax=Tetrabaena socialis TaxID=47790 RepID=A0A2J8AII4_9CHLO|nr:hypothetical protein TSOC_000815 [Tetrabaena socialis]|eukprot:PNH12321.1 hypothetical protein TSOC_000815 [Tetrabaena socialis]